METSQITLVLMSDTHGQHRAVGVPPGDILIHAGDFTKSARDLEAIEDFNAWLGGLPHRYKIVVSGNHEYWLEEEPRRKSLLSNAIVLLDDEVTISGLRIWGSPVTPLYGGAFGLSALNDRVRHWLKVPQVDVLITHGPPHECLARH